MFAKVATLVHDIPTAESVDFDLPLLVVFGRGLVNMNCNYVQYKLYSRQDEEQLT